MQLSEPAEYVIMGQLKNRPLHGYEMYQQIENGILGQIVRLEMSQMYAYLKKLERLACIEATLEAQGARPPRKVFHLTQQGQKLFDEWLGQPVEKPRDIRILFLIKLYFAQRFMPEQTEQLIKRQTAACQRFLHHLESQQSSNSEEKTRDELFFEHIVLRSRIHQTRALLDWMSELVSTVGT